VKKPLFFKKKKKKNYLKTNTMVNLLHHSPVIFPSFLKPKFLDNHKGSLKSLGMSRVTNPLIIFKNKSYLKQKQ